MKKKCIEVGVYDLLNFLYKEIGYKYITDEGAAYMRGRFDSGVNVKFISVEEANRHYAVLQEEIDELKEELARVKSAKQVKRGWWFS